MSLSNYPRFLFGVIEQRAPFHAAHSTFSGDGGSVSHHSHDYFEWILVVRGEAPHWVNGTWSALQEHGLTLIRPNDTHAILPNRTDSVEIINIAFPVKVWDDFVLAAGLQDTASIWVRSPEIISVQLLKQQSLELRREALAALRSYHQRPTRLALTAFLCAAAGMMLDSGRDFGKKVAQPIWLRTAVKWAEGLDASDVTLGGLIDAAGVSGAYLSRSMKATMGMTPTEFINTLRIKQAAYEIATTDRSIAEIAFESGFASLSYFYRRFSRIYGKTPTQYRADAGATLAPGGLKAL